MGGVWLDPFSGFAAWPNQTLINLRIQGRRAAQCNAECQSSFPTRSLSGARFSASLRTCALIYSFIKLCSICRAALLWKRKRRRTVNISKWMCIILIDALQSIEMRPPTPPTFRRICTKQFNNEPSAHICIPDPEL